MHQLQRPPAAAVLSSRLGCGLQDPSLKHTLQFGIGLHHAGLADVDRRVCEALFVAGKIQVTLGTHHRRRCHRKL